jgi:hypothetical protein
MGRVLEPTLPSRFREPVDAFKNLQSEWRGNKRIREGPSGSAFIPARVADAGPGSTRLDRICAHAGLS